MSRRTTHHEKELAHRVSHGVDVSLYWSERTNRVTVKVHDARSNESFGLEVDGRRALDAYRHAFAYLTRSAAGRRSPLLHDALGSGMGAREALVL